MRNYDETRRKLKELGWRRSDRTVNGIHQELWREPPLYGRSLIVPPSVPYWTACTTAGIEPALSKLRYAPRPSYKRAKTVQAKHVGDTRKVLQFIVDHCKTTGHLWTTYYDLEELYPDWNKFPDKVRRAKMASLVAKGYLDGCLCGCRGDFEPQRAAYEFLSTDRSRDDIKPGFKMAVEGRALRDMWWEGTTMCVQFHDTGNIVKFRDVSIKSYSMGAMQADGTATLSGVLQPGPIEVIKIDFVISDAPKT